jgi:glycosyltransferase involved in cell wall biosynthesis
MKIVYYTAVCFLDISLEVINVLKKSVDLHVIIEITPSTKTQNILDVERLPDDDILIHPEKVLSPESYKFFEPYILGTASVNFLVYSSKNILKTLKTSAAATQFIMKIKPDVLYLDGMAVRSLGIMPALFFAKKLMIGIHDPVAHKGEIDIKRTIVKLMFLNFPIKKEFFFYSDFAIHQFEQYHKKSKQPKWNIRMNPYTFFSRLPKSNDTEKTSILFFGRLSAYKGIEVLLAAMPAVFEKFPNQKLVIAGQAVYDYNVDFEVVQKYAENITVINRYITNNELVALVNQAKFVVCPYLEATQSGVLMTTYALNTPVVATNVGAFSEYVTENFTGMLTEVGNVPDLAKAMQTMLTDDYYKQLANNIAQLNTKDLWNENADSMLLAYAHGI